MREGLQAAGRIRDPDHAQELQRARLGGLAFHPAMDGQDLLDLAADVPDRVQRRLRLLEDHADPVAAIPAHRVVGERQQVLAVEDDLPALDATGFCDQAHDREARHALAATRFADDPHDLATVDVEVDAVDGADLPLARVERRPQAADLEKRFLAPFVLRATLRSWHELLDDRALDRRIEQRLGPRPERACFVGHRFSRGSSASRKPVADEVEREDAEGDRHTGEEDQVRRREEHGSGRWRS